jgi:hypothetical protein
VKCLADLLEQLKTQMEFGLGENCSLLVEAIPEAKKFFNSDKQEHDGNSSNDFILTESRNRFHQV